jgi:hypothetical protein
MIDYAPFQVVLAYIGFHLDKLVKADNAVNVVADLLPTLGLQIDEPGQVLFSHLLHALFSQTEAQVVVLHLEFRLCCNPMGFDIEGLEVKDLFVILADLHEFLQMKVDDHQ